MIHYADDVLKELQRHAGPPFARKLASEEDLKSLCQRVNPKNPAPMQIAWNPLRRGTVADYLVYFRMRSETDIQRILAFSIYIDKLIKLLNRILDSAYFLTCDSFLANIDQFKNSNLESVASELLRYLQMINDLEDYVDRGMK